MRVAVTGAGGRLGAALVEVLADSPFTGIAGPIGWGRDAFDLDRPESIHDLLDRNRPEVVVNAAAWTDVDGCARDPKLAIRRNADSVHVLAEACAARGVDLVQLSTNEVFDGRRTDGRGYEPGDAVGAINPYGESKLMGERLAHAAYRGAKAQLAVVRTAWLFGPGKPDFPSKILEAAERAAAAAQPLRVVADEFGSPTYVVDLAEAIADLLAAGSIGGVHHVVNGPATSRAQWAIDVVARARVDVRVEEVPATTWPRESTPPRWGVLDPTPLPSAEPLRPWPDAMADYMPRLLRDRAAAMSRSGGRQG